NSIGFKKSSEILNNLISELDSITSNISGQVNKTDSLILQLESGNKQLIDLNESIHSIDTNQITSRLSLFDSYYEQSKADINVTLQDIGRMRESVSSYKENALLVQGQINNVLNPFQSDLNLLNSIASESDEPQRTALLLLHEDLNNSFNEIRNASIGVNKVVSDLNEMEFKLASAEAKLFQANERLDFAKQEINEFSSELSKVSVLIEQAKELVASTFESKSIVVSELQNAKITFNELIKSLNLLKDFSPEFVVNPFKLEVEPVYGISKINAMIPLSIGLILLLTTLLLASSSVIIEREKGIYFRLKSSPTKHSTWIAGKILGQLFFALIESIIVLLVAVFLFSVSLPMNSIDLFIALTLISFSFICIGLFIPEIMKNQSTAILASLLILIPMLFLSGMIFPIEFMPSPVNLFASILPLTLANTILSSIIIKSVPITELSIELGFLLIPAMLLLLVVLIKNRK
ncbi:MAG TPA: ABC transporter permease, partial [archaeon]|nr:ABC transporter permease [archaeon]